jgi:hypothetical protein
VKTGEVSSQIEMLGAWVGHPANPGAKKISSIHSTARNRLHSEIAGHHPLAFHFESTDSIAMSSRELVIELVNKLPENASLAEIAREIELLAGIEKARGQARRGEGIPVEDARKLMDAWAVKQS